jgi:hypothetical protein
MSDACEFCGLPLAPSPLPDKLDRDLYCWRRRAPGSSFEAADMRECLLRLKDRYDDIDPPLKFQPLPYYGTLMTLAEFEAHGFIDYDGFGNYATENQMSNKTVYPSDVKKEKLDRSFSHVMWFNR